MTALPIDVVSDVVCPWCFIGKRRLEKAIALKPDIPVEVRYRPYFLNPWVPREGISRDEYLTTKFGSPERYRAIAQRVAAAAAAEGLSYVIDGIKRQPNTLDCHRLILWAGERRQRRHDEAAADGPLFHRGRRPHRPRGAGQGRGRLRPRRRPRARAAGRASRTSTASSRRPSQAKEAGIDGVPCFIFGGLLAVQGAQAPEHLAQAIERAARRVSAAARSRRDDRGGGITTAAAHEAQRQHEDRARGDPRADDRVRRCAATARSSFVVTSPTIASVGEAAIPVPICSPIAPAIDNRLRRRVRARAPPGRRRQHRRHMPAVATQRRPEAPQWRSIASSDIAAGGSRDRGRNHRKPASEPGRTAPANRHVPPAAARAAARARARRAGAREARGCSSPPVTPAIMRCRRDRRRRPARSRPLPRAPRAVRPASARAARTRCRQRCSRPVAITKPTE